MLMAAAASGHSDLVELLLQSGADVDAQHQESGCKTALQWACAGLHFPVVKQLLAAGATLDLTDVHGHTAFDALWQVSRDHGMRMVVLTPAELARLHDCIRVFTEHAAEVQVRLAGAAAATHAADSASSQRVRPGMLHPTSGQPTLSAEEIEFNEHCERERREKEALGSWAQQQVDRKRELNILRRENERREQMMLADRHQAALLANSLSEAIGRNHLDRAEAIAKGWAKQRQTAADHAPTEKKTSSTAGTVPV